MVAAPASERNLELGQMSLTVEQIERYRSDGWLAPIDVMSETEATALSEELEAAEAAYPEELHAEHRNNAHLAFPFLSDIARHPTIVSAVSSLVGPDISLWSTVLFIKEPDSEAFVSWHQDAFYMSLQPANFVTAWLALTPSTVESGCLSAIPGTHTGPTDHIDTFADENILTRGQQIADVAEDRAVHLELKPGQMSLHHPWLIHGSQPNRSTGRRVGVAMQSYLGGEVRPISGEHHVMHIAGQPIDETFVEAPAPIGVCTEPGRAARAAANQAFADVLYAGAEKRRSL